MSKTPVSILQELMVKKNTIPNYELLSSSEGIGTHTPTFYYRVTADGLKAVGKGRSKKEAKHEAARLALEKLATYGDTPLPDMPPSPNQSSTPDPSSPQMIQINAIGALQELCSERNIPTPIFELISDVGPAHLRQFTIKCTVSTMVVTAMDTTKKKARQHAAQKMLQRLIDTLPEEIEEMIISADSPNNFPAIEASDEVLKAYHELSFSKKKINWGMKVSNFFKSFKNLMDEKELKYSDLWEDDSQFDVSLIKVFLDKLDLHLNEELIEQEDSTIAIMSIDSDPEFVIAGTGQTEESAKVNAYNNILSFLNIMTK